MKKKALFIICVICIMLTTFEIVGPERCRNAAKQTMDYITCGADYPAMLETLGRSLTEEEARAELKDAIAGLLGEDEALIAASADAQSE